MPPVPPSQKIYQRFVRILASVAVAWALLSLLGGLPGRDRGAMPPASAALMLVLGLALALPWARGRGSRTVLALGALACLASLGALAGGTWPELPPLTAASTLGLGLALVLVGGAPGARWRVRQAGAILALGPLGLCLVALVSGAAGIPLRLGGTGPSMPLPAAGTGILLSLAVLLAAGVDTWPLALFGARAARAPSAGQGRVRWGPLGVFLTMALAILAGGIVILKGQLKTASLIIQDELSAIAEVKTEQLSDGYYVQGEEAARRANRTVVPGLPSAETLVVAQDGDDAVYLSERLHPADSVQGLRVPIADHPGALPVLAALGREGLFRGDDYRGRPVVAALRRVPGTPWGLMVKVDEADMHGPMGQRALTTGLMLLGLIALVAMGVGLVVRHQDAGRILGQLALERERKALAERSDHLMRHANDIILLTDLEGRIVETNMAASEDFGFSPGEFRAMRLRDLRPPAQAPQLLERFQALLAAGSARFESCYRRKDGSEFPAEVSARVISLGEESLALHFIRDITERKSLEARLQQSQKLESLGSLAGGVAHDMNNVLGAILGLASARREGLDAADPMAASLDTIAAACVRGREVVRSLLYFARKDLAEPRPLDLNVLVRDMVQLLGFTTLKRVSLEMDLHEPLNRIVGDGGALSHALMNLCVNALDAMPGKGALRLATANLAGGGARVTVRDTGEGMPEVVLARAVEPFYTTKPLGKGTGLGLAMVSSTMRAHGGTLDIQSRPGHGTEVTLTFPCPAGEPQALASNPAAPRPAQGGLLNILVVDDDELIRESLVPMLEILGHSAQAAAGGLEAVAMFEGGLAVDLVILDMNMPGINGAETLTRIKALRPGQAVLMSSGFNDTEVNGLVSQHAGVHCIQKPFSMNELRRKLDGIPV